MVTTSGFALGITQKTAWFLLHSIRLAMQAGSLEMKSGQIEADETFVGGKAKNMHKDKREQVIQGRGPVGKAIVMGILERNEEGSKMKTMVVPDHIAETLREQIRAKVEADSEVITDEHAGYNGLETDYIHSVINHAKEYVNGHIHTNGAENFWTLFKRCINGTYVSVECDHLSRYLDEEMFRFNERKGKDKNRFAKVLEGTNDCRVTYKQLTYTEDGLGRRGRLPKLK